MGITISVRELNAWFGRTQALYDIDMQIPADHVTAIIGPSGCGKSTFVRCLNRMHETIPDANVSGEVTIGNLDPSNANYRMAALMARATKSPHSSRRRPRTDC